MLGFEFSFPWDSKPILTSDISMMDNKLLLGIIVVYLTSCVFSKLQFIGGIGDFIKLGILNIRFFFIILGINSHEIQMFGQFHLNFIIIVQIHWTRTSCLQFTSLVLLLEFRGNIEGDMGGKCPLW